jgi:hypothetical protein
MHGLARVRLLSKQVSGFIVAPWTCCHRWEFRTLVPTVPKEGTFLVGVKLEPLMGSISPLTFLLIFHDKCS